MSITAVCSGCQKGFKAPEEYAGKKVRCKNCGATFRVPGSAAGAGAASAAKGVTPARTASAPTKARSAPAAAAAPLAADEDGEYGLADDLGPVQPAVVMPPPTTAAPAAGRSAAAPALSYASAGTGTVRPPGGTMFPSTAGSMASRHGAAASAEGHNWMLISQVAAFGVPLLLLMLGKLVPAMLTAGILAGTFVGLAFMLWGQIGILIAAIQESSLCALLYLFVPLYPIYYILTRFEDVGPYVIRTVAGVALIIGSVMMIPQQ